MLTELQLDSTPVEDVTPLAKLTLLEDITVKGTKVKDLSPLKDLKKLKKFDGRDTPADDDPMSFAALRANGVKVAN
jgi:internalin A